MERSGILVIDKPTGPTSFDVVARVRSTLKTPKVGHTGTLDPLATGVLPICIGSATKLAGYLTEGDKTYEATVRLGESTDTQDAQGTILQKREVVDLTPARLEATLQRFRGPILQIPPMYSAVKVDGKRLYELARKGQEVERAPRPVTVYAFELLEFGVPEIRIRVRCSKGTYVRTLAHDLGEALGFGAHLTALRRTQSGPFSIAEAIPLQQVVELGPARREEAFAWLRPLAEAFAELPTLQLDAALVARKVLHGQPLELPASLAVPEGQKVRLLGPSGEMVALAERRGAQLRYLRVLAGA